MLHILTKIDNLRALYQSELPVNIERDVFLLTQDCVYAAIKDHKDHLLIQSLKQCYFLQQDLEARGISSLINDNIQMVSYLSFVSLTQEHYPVVTW